MWIHSKAMHCRQIRLSSSSSSPFTCFLASLLFFLFFLPFSPSFYFSSLLFLQQTSAEDLSCGKHYPGWGGLNGSINRSPCPQGNKHRNRSMTIALWYGKHFACKLLRGERGIYMEKLTFVLALQRWIGVRQAQKTGKGKGGNGKKGPVQGEMIAWCFLGLMCMCAYCDLWQRCCRTSMIWMWHKDKMWTWESVPLCSVTLCLLLVVGLQASWPICPSLCCLIFTAEPHQLTIACTLAVVCSGCSRTMPGYRRHTDGGT